MSYGQYVALVENSAPGALEDELRRRRQKMPDYKAFLAQKAKRNARKTEKNAQKPAPRERKSFKIKPDHVTAEHVRCCPVCGVKFKTTDRARKYCSMKCAIDARNRQQRARWAEKKVE